MKLKYLVLLVIFILLLSMVLVSFQKEGGLGYIGPLSNFSKADLDEYKSIMTQADSEECSKNTFEYNCSICSEGPYKIDKAIFIDENTNQISMFSDLNVSQANNPNEVKTIIKFKSYYTDPIGHYEKTGDAAVIQSKYFAIYDRKSKRYVSMVNLHGETPPDSKNVLDSGMGAGPSNDEINACLNKENICSGC